MVSGNGTREGGGTRLRIGVIGAGMIGSWHARILSELGGVTLAGICDTDAGRAAALAGGLGAPSWDDPVRFLAQARLDGVIIATPEGVHAEQVALAADAGCAVLIEKPAAPDTAGVRAIMETVARSGIMAMVGHVERFEPGSAQLREAVAQGVCGQIAAILARRQFGPAGAEKYTGSSTLRILAVHDFDLVRWVHPAPVSEVYAVAGRGALHAAHGIDDHVITSIRFDDGAVACVESGWTLPRSYAEFDTPAGWQAAGNNRLDVYGADGFVSNDMALRHQPLVAFDAAGGFRAAGIRHQPVVHGRVQGALRTEVAHFVDCIATGRTPVAGLEDALRAVALVEAAESSLTCGRPVRPGA